LIIEEEIEQYLIVFFVQWRNKPNQRKEVHEVSTKRGLCKEKKFMEKQASAVVVSFQNPPFSPSRDKRLIFSNYSSPRSLIFSNC
jgi:putative ribosome biogenesis GTPase RsgA